MIRLYDLSSSEAFSGNYYLSNDALAIRESLFIPTINPKSDTFDLSVSSHHSLTNMNHFA